jgi:N6-L-threonylcarbamoyladenine synthase
VAANQRLRDQLEQRAAALGLAWRGAPLAYCTDNAAMIALAAAERLRLGLVSDIDAPARPRWPLDEARAIADPVHPTGRKGAKA